MSSPGSGPAASAGTAATRTAMTTAGAATARASAVARVPDVGLIDHLHVGDTWWVAQPMHPQTRGTGRTRWLSPGRVAVGGGARASGGGLIPRRDEPCRRVKVWPSGTDAPAWRALGRLWQVAALCPTNGHRWRSGCSSIHGWTGVLAHGAPL